MKRVRLFCDVKTGDYVLCTKYQDRDPKDQWQVGFIDTVEQADDKQLLFLLKDPQRSYFKCCWLITRDEGRKIVESENPRAVRCGRNK